MPPPDRENRPGRDKYHRRNEEPSVLSGWSDQRCERHDEQWAGRGHRDLSDRPGEVGGQWAEQGGHYQRQGAGLQPRGVGEEVEAGAVQKEPCALNGEVP